MAKGVPPANGSNSLTLKEQGGVSRDRTGEAPGRGREEFRGRCRSVCAQISDDVRGVGSQRRRAACVGQYTPATNRPVISARCTGAGPQPRPKNGSAWAKLMLRSAGV